MIAHAENGEPESPQNLFREVDTFKPLCSHPHTVSEPRRQARGGGFLRRGQPEPSRESPNVVLGEAGVGQRSRDVPFGGRAQTRAVVAKVVEVGPNGDVRASRLRYRTEYVE